MKVDGRTAANRKRCTVHGKSRTSTHNIWWAMRQRCENPNSQYFADYGGRGIKVCERWRNFENFLADMGERPAGMTIERKDNNLGYDATNCIWAPLTRQARNKRNNVLVTHNGETKLLVEWCEQLGIKYTTGYMRVARGLPITGSST